MKTKTLEILKCPKTKGKLRIADIKDQNGNEILEGSLVNEQGDIYPISKGIPDLVTAEDLTKDANFARQYYKGIASTYDLNVDITFRLYNEDELTVRNSMIDMLELKPDNRVLEVSAGTGKDSELILKRLSKDGALFCVDLSPDMIFHAK